MAVLHAISVHHVLPVPPSNEWHIHIKLCVYSVFIREAMFEKLWYQVKSAVLLEAIHVIQRTLSHRARRLQALLRLGDGDVALV